MSPVPLPSTSGKQDVGFTGSAQVRDAVTAKDNNVLLSSDLVTLVQEGLLGLLDADGLVVRVRTVVSVGDEPLLVLDLAVVGQDRNVGGLLAQVPGQVLLDNDIEPAGDDGEWDVVLLGIVVEGNEAGIDRHGAQEIHALGKCQRDSAPPHIHGLARRSK